VRMPSRPPSVSKDTVEASATAMADEMERVHDLPGDDDDDMGDEEVEELFGRGAVPGGAGAEDPIPIFLTLVCLLCFCFSSSFSGNFDSKLCLLLQS